MDFLFYKMKQENIDFMDLKWPNHFQHLKSMITIMFKSIDSTTDVTLVCDDGKEINAHKVVLCASSNFLNNAISRNENLKKVSLKGIQHQEMKSILEFMYLGVVKVSQDKINEWIYAAKILEVHEFEKIGGFRKQDRANKVACKECKIKFRDNQTLSRHIQTKHEEVTYACEKCDYQTHRKDTLREHIHIKHLKTKFTCSSCNFEGNRRAVSDHKLVAHKGKIFHCSYCDYQAKNRYYLNQHKKINHDGIIYDCKECDFKAPRKSQLKYHVMNHEDYQASSIGALSQHKNTDHKNETFDLQVSKKLPINHTLKHKGMEFPCFKCSFKSTTKLQLRYHYQIEHKENKKSS